MATLVAAAACKNATPALDLKNLDKKVSPKEDFYQYATGGWQKRNPLKPEFARFGSFDAIAENTREQLNELFSSMTKMEAEPGSVDQKISDLYKMGLDSASRNAAGAEPILKYIAEIQAIDSKDAFVEKLAQLHTEGGEGLFGAFVEADFMDSDSQILFLGQGGLGMRDRDYYLNPENAALKEGYRAYIEKIFNLSGVDNAAERAANVLAVEDALAEVSWTKEQNRNIPALYNPRSSKETIAAWPSLRLGSYYSTRGIAPQDKLVVAQPSFFDGLDKIIDTTPLETLKDYLLGHFISDAATALSEDFYLANWDFFSRQMAGTKEPQPLWKRAMSVPNGILGEAVGKMYVERYFPESSKQKMITLVENLRIALGQHIDNLDWMGDETKAAAKAKLATFTVKIGYPDKWKDYSTLIIDPEQSYFENLRAASQWYVADNMSKLGQPTDKTEWGMSPQTVNAYYNPTTNEICFPAAILQRPFFNPDADEAVNYGGIGVVIGHEMSHGFDDQGRQFDADGNMVNWWTAEDEARFNEKAEVLAAQFDAVEILPGVHANGHFTLGENIGDHGGLSIAYSALHNVIDSADPGLIDGFTPDQRFYLSYGTIWAQNITEEEMLRLTNLDVHSLARNRVNVSLRNFQTFFDAFDIQEGDPMFRPESERVHIW